MNMVKRELACRNCKTLTTEKVCPNCQSTNLSQNWKGLVIINDPDSDIAKVLGFTKPGRYALYVG